MRAFAYLGLLLVAFSFVSAPASARCETVTASAHPDINYTTLCVLHDMQYDDTTQFFDNDYVAHGSHAVEVDPAFDYWHANVDQGSWTYDDGEVSHERTWTTIGSGWFVGVRGLVGTGYHAHLHQRDQTAGEDGDGACSGILGQSTCLGAGGWFTAQDIASVGAAAYYQQSGSGDECVERFEIDVDAGGVVFVPIVTEPQPCTSEMPSLYDELAFRDLPVLA